MDGLDAADRHFLRESRLISPDMEKVVKERAVHISPDCQDSIMVNEEDHLRIQCMVPGLQLQEVVTRLNHLESQLAEALHFAFSEKLGYLTACPTNTGTGLRISVMLHLPALSLLRSIEEILQGIGPYGLTVRGFYGENSEFQGDFFQISNEITLGKSEDEIRDILQRVMDQIIRREEEARTRLFETRRTSVEDVFWRSLALLSYARRMNSQEAMKHLSRLRLGIDTGMLTHLSHQELNRLVIEAQPAHLEVRYGDGGEMTGESRDELRAKMLRDRLAPPAQN
jgi:protein arginine kinase